jgi:FtsZ-interacting cell division protein ZipA
MLSDFQLALIGIAAVAVIGVIVYNRWQESKYRRRAEQAFGRGDNRPDALFAERVEPSLGRVSQIEADEAAALDALTAPIPTGGHAHASAAQDLTDDFASPVEEQLVAKRPVIHGAATDLQPAINGEIDSIAMILADAPVDADRYAPMIAESQKISPHLLWEGMVGGLWQPIDPTLDEKYRELRAGLQLADRAGPVEADTLAAFDDAMSRYATALQAVSQRENVAEATRRAQMVDAFCAETDIEIAVNIVGRSGVTFAATKLRGLAEAQGLTALASGEYAMKDDYGRVLFTMRNGNPNEALGLKTEQPYFSQISLAIDVPRTPQPSQNFERMFNLALHLADILQGEVVDDNRRVLTANGRRVIADTIHEITGEMQQRSIVPGSSVALRLYA